ncbi:hypothetical protein Tco_1328657 [Tanacetum coccineum]
MGAQLSCKTSESEVIRFNKIRVVHMDGSLEDYEDPATVEQVITNFPKHFLCTPIEIIQSGLVPLKLDHHLKSGQIYFLLPNSTLKFNASPEDLASLTRKLINIAKTGRCCTKRVPTTPASAICNLQATSPSQFLDSRYGEIGEGVCMLRSQRWKPILAAITEG